MDVAAEKRRLRAEVQARVKALPPARRALEEELVQAAVQADAAWARARTVLLYRPLSSEFSVTGLTNAAWRDGKRVVLPRVDGEHLCLHLVESWSQLSPGSFGIAEPAATAPQVDAVNLDLAMVPGVAWDAAGGRLGRGGGHFDRLLPLLGCPTWGVGFDCQVVAAVPREAHDVGVSRVWSAKLVGLGQT